MSPPRVFLGVRPQGAALPAVSIPRPSLCADITGPIILQTYRAIADYEKSSKTEMTVATGDVVDVVEKSESGQATSTPGFGGGHMKPLSLC